MIPDGLRVGGFVGEGGEAVLCTPWRSGARWLGLEAARIAHLGCGPGPLAGRRIGALNGRGSVG